MSKTEIVVLVIVGVILLFIFGLYIYHSIKMRPKKIKEEKVAQEDSSKKVVTVAEQKPVAVGIIKEEKPAEKTEDVTEQYDLAPFKEHTETKQEEIKKEVNSLSPDMKKVIMTDLLKPKF